MPDILTWTHHSKDAIASSGGQHRYTAVKVCEPGPSAYPWYLRRDDGRYTRGHQFGVV
jgi:hypothetical protein